MSSTRTTRPSFSTRLRGLAATLGILAILVGMPLVMLALGSEPIPHHIPDWSTLKHDLFSRDDGTFALEVIKAVVWIAWLVAAVLILLELGYKVGHVKARDLPILGKPQSAARNLVAAASLLFVAGPVLATAVGHAGPAVAASAPLSPASATPTTSVTASVQHQQAPAHHETRQDTRPTFSYSVREGDNLWDLAQTFLGDGNRYHELVELNRHIVGDNPGFLEQGWVLKIPGTHDAGRARAYVIEHGDTLEDIAATHLGDPNRWPEIFQASTAITQPDGHHITNPDLILPGYTVHIPQQRTNNPSATGTQTKTDPLNPRHHEDAPTDQAPHDTTPVTPVQPITPVQPQSPAQPTAPAHSATPSPQEPAAAQDTPRQEASSDDTNILSAPWVVSSLAGGAVLSGILLLALRRRRRRQFEVRRPGRAIAVPPPELAPYEKTITVAGHPMEQSIEFLNAVLRQLALDIAAAHETAPPVAAVELTETSATLHLTEPADLPDPWIGSPDKLRWTATTSAHVAAGPHSAPAPFPLLATIGRDEQGHWWLLNLEHLGTITIGGDTDRARDLLRYVACELALAPWADSARIDSVGIGSEAARMNSTRTRYHDTDTEAADSVLASALEMIDRAEGLGTDTPTGRATQIDDELWLARLLLVDAVDADEASLQRLIDLITDHPDRTGVSVVLADRDLAGGFAIDLSTEGRLRVEKAGLDLIPVGLTADAADGAAQVIEQSQDVDDVEVPIDESAVDGWESFTDKSGAIRREYTLPRNVQEITEADAEPARSLLEDDDQAYVEAAAVTEEDLEQVAPRVPVKVCEAVEAELTTLDEDYQAWITKDPARPRLRLLGPVKLAANGDMTEVADRIGFYTELAAYLASKSRYGATTDEVVEAFGYENKNRVRVDMTILRDWLGTNPVSGQPFLPKAPDAPAKREHGKNVYQLDTGPGGVIVDTRLFEMKKARAQSRGEAGMVDLREALTLVDGVPYSKLRETGWSWLLEGDRADHQAVRMISDAAHVLTTHYLKQDAVKDAYAVAKVGVLAAPDEQTMQFNLARVMKAEGRLEEAEKLLNDEVYNRSDDGLAPRDLSERSRKIISSWKATG